VIDEQIIEQLREMNEKMAALIELLKRIYKQEVGGL